MKFGITHRLQWILLLLSATISLFACSSDVRSYLRQGTDIRKINRVAVLPLENHTQDRYAGEKIRELVMMGLLKRGVEVIETGEVNDLLYAMKIRSIRRLSRYEISDIGRRLKIDAVVLGAVDTFDIKHGISVTYPEVSIYLSMIDTRSGDIIWSTWHTSGGASFWTRHFGTETETLDEVAKKVVKEALDTVF